MMFTEGTNRWILIALITIPVYYLSLIFYRLYLHPLSRYPGPKLAAISTLYRAYHEAWRDGCLVEQVTELHKHYGPVVRITPNTLHFRNPQAFHDIFSPQSKTGKDQEFLTSLGMLESSFKLEGEMHRTRWKLMAPFFKPAYLGEIHTVILKNAQRFCDLLQPSAKHNMPVELAFGFRSLTLDFINEMIFPVLPSNFRTLNNGEFSHPLCRSTFLGYDWTFWLMRNFPITHRLHSIANYLPSCLRVGYHNRNVEEKTMTDLFHHNLASPQLKTQASFLRMLMDSKAEKNNIVLSIPEVFGELMGIMQGAVIDISNVLPYCAFRIARDPEVQRKLLVELQTVWKNPDEPIPPCEVLGNLPYLKGVVKESLRLTHGVISGMPRVVTVEGTQIDGNLIPSGTVVVTSSSYVHMDSTIFPDPERFIPERWHAEDPQLDRSLASFSKGRRMCPGAHISYPHLSTATAAVFRKFEVSLYETTDEDMKYKTYVSIHFTGRPLRVTLKPRPS